MYNYWSCLIDSISQQRMDCEASARDLLERMLLDTSAEPTALPLSLLRSITNNFSMISKLAVVGLQLFTREYFRMGLSP